MDIHILNRRGELLEQRLTRELPGCNIKVFPTAVDYYTYIKHSAAMLDLFIVTDGGISGNNVDINENTTCLKNLFNYDLFTPKIILFINSKGYEEHHDKYVYLEKYLRKKHPNGDTHAVEILEVDLLDENGLRDIITRRTVKFTPINSQKKAVVKVDRNSKALTDSTIIPEMSTQGVIALRYSNDDYIMETIKKNNEGNSTPIDIDSKDEELIGDIPDETIVNIDFDSPKITKHVKYICVTGLGSSGVSTTALTMAMTGAQEGKTLLIDSDMYMGLSYMVEKIIPNSKYLNINLEKLVKEKDRIIEEYQEQYINSPNLHVMRMTLPTMRAAGHSPIEYIILNLLALVEDQYQYIIFDLPIRMMEKFSNLLGKADLILTCTAPYQNKVIPLLMTLKDSLVLTTKAYKQDLVMNYFIGQPDLNELPTMTIKEFNTYSHGILGKTLPCTKPYICTHHAYIAEDHFRGIIAKAEALLNNGQEEDFEDGLVLINRR